MDEPGFTTQDRRFLNGSIDEVHVFDRPLTECEVKVNALVPCPVDTDGDGVDDSEDNCSNTPAGSIVNADGCAPPLHRRAGRWRPGQLLARRRHRLRCCGL